MYPRLEMLLPQLLLFWDYKGAPPRSEKSHLAYSENKIMKVPKAGKTCFQSQRSQGGAPEQVKAGSHRKKACLSSDTLY